MRYAANVSVGWVKNSFLVAGKHLAWMVGVHTSAECVPTPVTDEIRHVVACTRVDVIVCMHTDRGLPQLTGCRQRQTGRTGRFCLKRAVDAKVCDHMAEPAPIRGWSDDLLVMWMGANACSWTGQ
jgi:hypothetical protein